MRSTSRAKVCAVAVIALGAPSLDRRRRNFAPSALRLRIRLQAARRKAVAARFTTRRGPALEHLAATGTIVRAQAEPRSEVLLCLPPTHVQSHLRDHRLPARRHFTKVSRKPVLTYVDGKRGARLWHSSGFGALTELLTYRLQRRVRSGLNLLT